MVLNKPDTGPALAGDHCAALYLYRSGRVVEVDGNTISSSLVRAVGKPVENHSIYIGSNIINPTSDIIAVHGDACACHMVS